MTARAFVRHHAVAVYFGIAYLLSALGVLLVYGPEVLAGQTSQSAEVTRSLAAFPLLIVGVGVTGLTLTGVVTGKSGLRTLLARMLRWRVGAGWYAVLFLPPFLIVTVLFLFRSFVSSDFGPRFFIVGLLFGLPAGFFEEIGWTGYAFPRMRSECRYGPLTLAVILGALWGLWHLPVVDHLGAASPHRAFWLPFFLSFIALVTAIRVLIVWAYSNTGSILVAQLIHVSSTGSLVVLSPVRVSPAQETCWYAAYAAALWVAVGCIAAAYGKRLRRGSDSDGATGSSARCNLMHDVSATSTSR